MKPHHLFFIVILFLFTTTNLLFSQSPTSPVIAMRVITTPIANDTANGLMAITDSTVFAVTMKIMLEDTTSIDEILVQLGNQGNPTSNLQYTFEWDVSPGGNYSFSRNEFNLDLGLGSYAGLINYEATLRIKRTNGSYSDFIHFSR